MWKGTVTDTAEIATTLYYGIFNYAGWNFLNFVTEELKNPFVNLPRAIYISLPFVTIIYLLANIAFFTVLTVEDILESETVGFTFGLKVFGALSWIMPVFVSMSTFGALNGNIFASSRLVFVGARGGHLPESVASVNILHFTPMPALVFLGLISFIYLCLGIDLESLIAYTSFIESLCVTASVGGLLWLRYKEPKLERPIKMNLIIPIVFFIMSLFITFLPIRIKTKETMIGFLLMLLGIPVYLVTIYWKSKPKFYRNFMESTTKFIQIFFLSERAKED